RGSARNRGVGERAADEVQRQTRNIAHADDRVDTSALVERQERVVHPLTPAVVVGRDVRHRGGAGGGRTAPAAQIVEREAIEQRGIEAPRARAQTTIDGGVERSGRAVAAVRDVLVTRRTLCARNAAIPIQDVEDAQARVEEAITTSRVER